MATTERYLRLTALGQKAFNRGNLHRSLRLFQAAEEEALKSGDRDLADRAFCNRCVVLLELDRLDGSVGELKQVLMRSRDPFTSWMAAYYTAQVYEAEGNLQRALAYARRACELAEVCGDERTRFHSANQHGVLALRQSRFSEAAESFTTALALAEQVGADPLGVAIVRDNLGYCLMCLGQWEAGLALCEDAAATVERLGTRQYLPEVYQDICYGYLSRGNFAIAEQFGLKALALAREYGYRDVERNVLMLLADAAFDEHHEVLANHYLNQLAEHYPDLRGMQAFFRAFNVREVINLKA
ncbi:MAG: tetratricopeptide repeat protein [Thermoanaerobaculum sp.]|nr:tetratricopeptide repeat protein [Thermoanaerobaculum sp.]MDW7966815.1 tetratricopeptide repeat protein [Thermoanaerobaculum sp.]